jgi:hypothetical protein
MKDVNPFLVCIEKIIDPSDSQFLKVFPSALEIFLSNIDITSLDIDDQLKLIEFGEGRKNIISYEWIMKEIPSFSRRRHLKSTSLGDMDDFIFCYP